MRIFDRSGNQFEGNVHFGYRKMYEAARQVFGIYGAFDRKRTIKQNYFNQLTLGVEYWYKRLFIGGNIYKPIGVIKKQIFFDEKISLPKLNISEETAQVRITATRDHEKSMGGIDATFGYEMTDNLTGYAGGYYFAASGVQTVAGPRIKFTYDCAKPNGHLLGVLDSVSVETGIQYDKPRRFNGYIGVKFKIDLTGGSTNNLQGFGKHMTELVRRDEDVVLGKMTLPDTSVRTVTHRTTVQDLVDVFDLRKMMGDISTAALVAILAEKHSMLTDPKFYPDMASLASSISFYTGLIYGIAQLHEWVRKDGAAPSTTIETFRVLLGKEEEWKKIKLLVDAFPENVATNERSTISVCIADNYANKIKELKETTDVKQIAKGLFEFMSQADGHRSFFKNNFNDAESVVKFKEFFRKAALFFHPDKGGDPEIFIFLSDMRNDITKVKSFLLDGALDAHAYLSAPMKTKSELFLSNIQNNPYPLVVRETASYANDTELCDQCPNSSAKLPTSKRPGLERVRRGNMVHDFQLARIYTSQFIWGLQGVCVDGDRVKGDDAFLTKNNSFSELGFNISSLSKSKNRQPAKVEHDLVAISNIEPLRKGGSWFAYFMVSKVGKISETVRAIYRPGVVSKGQTTGNNFKLQSVPLRFLGKYAEKSCMNKSFTVADEWYNTILSDTNYVCWFTGLCDSGPIAKVVVPTAAKIFIDQSASSNEQAKNIGEAFHYYLLLTTLSVSSQLIIPSQPLLLEFIAHISAKYSTSDRNKINIAIGKKLCAYGFGTCAPRNLVGSYVHAISSGISGTVDNLVPDWVEEMMDRAVCHGSKDYNKCMFFDNAAEVAWFNRIMINTAYFVSVVPKMVMFLHNIFQHMQRRIGGGPRL